MSVKAMQMIRLGLVGSKAAEQTTELDNHADACAVGEGTALVIHDYDRPVSVYGYKEGVGDEVTCRTVSAVVAYDHPETGDTYMLVFHQAILVPDLQANLLCSMQMRENDLKVNDEPKHSVAHLTDDHHAIIVPSNDGSGEALQIPLTLKGVSLCFPSRKPTTEEWEITDEERCLDMTPDEPEWDPKSTRFQEQEEAMLDSRGLLKDLAPRKWTTE